MLIDYYYITPWEFFTSAFIIIIIIILLFREFFTLALADGFFFGGGLSDSKSPQASRTLLSILADFNNVVGLHSSSYFQVLQSLYQFSVDCTKRTSYSHCHVP